MATPPKIGEWKKERLLKDQSISITWKVPSWTTGSNSTVQPKKLEKYQPDGYNPPYEDYNIQEEATTIKTESTLVLVVHKLHLV